MHQPRIVDNATAQTGPLQHSKIFCIRTAPTRSANDRWSSDSRLPRMVCSLHLSTRMLICIGKQLPECFLVLRACAVRGVMVRLEQLQQDGMTQQQAIAGSVALCRSATAAAASSNDILRASALHLTCCSQLTAVTTRQLQSQHSGQACRCSPPKRLPGQLSAWLEFCPYL